MSGKRRTVAGSIALGVGALALTGCAGRSSAPAVTLGLDAEPVRMVAAPASVRRACERSRWLPAACPRRLPYVGPRFGWDVFVCLPDQRGCLGLVWDDLELQHAGRGPMRPPTWSHVAIFAGHLTGAFPFRYPTARKTVHLRDGAFERAGSAPLFFGATTWGGKTGTLILAPDFPRGGEQGGHLIFRWQGNGVEYAIGLHAWEPLTQAAATLRAIVIAAGP